MTRYYRTSSHQNEKNSKNSGSHQNRGKGCYRSDSYKDKRTHSRSYYSVSHQDKVTVIRIESLIEIKVTVIGIEAEVKIITFLSLTEIVVSVIRTEAETKVIITFTYLTGIKLEAKVEVDLLYKEEIMNGGELQN
ncbi:unnamed protein product [Rhizophagus irregularis]|nr:unnamed protein product [Rhizophagus irregularis]